MNVLSRLGCGRRGSSIPHAARKTRRTRQRRRMTFEGLERRELLSGTDGPDSGSETAPVGDSVYAAREALSWTRLQSQIGTHSLRTVAPDLAGDGGSQNMPVQVTDTTVSQQVRIRLQVCDLSGNPITTVRPGTQFLLQAYVTDLRPASEGVYAAYLDITYDGTLVSAVGNDRDDMTFGETYIHGTSGDLTGPGLIEEVGAFSGSFVPLGGAERLLFSVKMIAEQPGTVVFVGNPAEDYGHEVLVYGSDEVVDSGAVTFIPVTLTVDTDVALANDVLNLERHAQNDPLARRHQVLPLDVCATLPSREPRIERWVSMNSVAPAMAGSHELAIDAVHTAVGGSTGLRTRLTAGVAPDTDQVADWRLDSLFHL
jgi:hypothetical protein